jgi:hypothetical protein
VTTFLVGTLLQGFSMWSKTPESDENICDKLLGNDSTMKEHKAEAAKTSPELRSTFTA